MLGRIPNENESALGISLRVTDATRTIRKISAFTLNLVNVEVVAWIYKQSMEG